MVALVLLQLIAAFLRICDSMRNKTQKITKIFEKLEQLNNQGVTLWAKRIGPVIIKVLHQLQSAAN